MHIKEQHDQEESHTNDLSRIRLHHTVMVLFKHLGFNLPSSISGDEPEVVFGEGGGPTSEQLTDHWDEAVALMDSMSKEELDIYLFPEDTALNYLDNTRVYLERFMETGVEIPDDIKAKRAEARSILGL